MDLMENKFIYQIYPKSFFDSNNDGVGDLTGIIKKINYIKGLGVDYIWLTPILCSPQNDNGYDISDYYSIDPLFGTLEDYKELIKVAKQNGIKIMFDLVLNHVSTEHLWFKEALSGNKEYIDYFVWRKKPNELTSAFGTNAWTYVQSLDLYYLHLFDQTQADLNWHNPKVRNELYKMINYWIDIGVEGFRLDVIDLIAKEPDKLITSRGPKFQEYLEELVENTFQNKYLTVGECWNFGPENTLDITGSVGLTQAFHFSHLNWIYPKWGMPKISVDNLVKTMNNWQQSQGVIEALVLNNHDLPRLQSYWYGPSKNKYDNYLKCTMLFALNLLSKGNTYIYQGEEIGTENAYNFKLEDYNDVETKNKIKELKSYDKPEEEILTIMHTVSRDNARTPMNWEDCKFFGFSKVKPWINFGSNLTNVESDILSSSSVYDMYKKMIEWKKVNYKFFKDFTAESKDNLLVIKNNCFVMLINLSDSNIENEFSKMERQLSNYKIENKFIRPYEFVVYK